MSNTFYDAYSPADKIVASASKTEVTLAAMVGDRACIIDLSFAQAMALSKRLAELASSNEVKKLDSLKPDPVNHPEHYTSHPSGVECIDITRHMGFNLGNAIKYVWRADLKGNAIEDLEKARFYLNDEIEKRQK